MNRGNEMVKLVGEIRSIVTMLDAATDTAAQAILEGNQATLLESLEYIGNNNDFRDVVGVFSYILLFSLTYRVKNGFS